MASAAFAGVNDSFAEERYRIKYGRNTPAEEFRQAAEKAEPTTVTSYAGHDCCWQIQQQAAHAARIPLNSSGVEERFRAKYGRSSPSAETLEREAEERTAECLSRCAELGQCGFMHIATADSSATSENVSDSEARFQAKYGRNTPAEEQRRAVREERSFDRSADRMPCEEQCCKHCR